MSKSISFNPLFVFVFFYSVLICDAQIQSAAELRNKLSWITKSLLDTNNLPIRITKLNGTPYKHNFMYKTTRPENKVIDSVVIMLALNDTAQRLGFYERHNILTTKEKTYAYIVDREATIVYAYREITNGKLNDKQFLEEIDRLPVSESMMGPARKNVDQKILEMYTAKLITSVDELYNILLKK